jgi:hypothetical protein
MDTSQPQNRREARPHRHRFFVGTGNALRRPSDRFQVWFGLLLMALLILGAPAGGWVAGAMTHTAYLRIADTQRAERHQVMARLTANATVVVSGRVVDEKALAPVRWNDGDGSVHSGKAEVAKGSERGMTVRIWVGPEGVVTVEPMTSANVKATAWAAGLTAAATVAAVTLGVGVCVRAVLDRRRYAAWGKEWESLEPQWSRRTHE